MSMMTDNMRLQAVERLALKVIRPESLPGIDISPIIDALMQWFLTLLEDCPKQNIQEVVASTRGRPLKKWFWRRQLDKRLPANVTGVLPDAAVDILDAAAGLTAQEWDSIGD